MKFPTLLLIAALFVFLVGGAQGDQNEPAMSRPKIMVVGVYHFVSKANVASMSVDDPLTPERQEQIKEVVTHLAKFQPTKVVLEEKAETSDLPNERIVVLYGQGHEFLLKQFIRESPDLELVDALDFL